MYLAEVMQNFLNVKPAIIDKQMYCNSRILLYSCGNTKHQTNSKNEN